MKHNTDTPEATKAPMPFQEKMKEHGLQLTRERSTTLQVNLGLKCNLVCRHCHLEAGPARKEVMSMETAKQVARAAAAFGFDTIDLTGGAPEMNPHLPEIITRLQPLAPAMILRSSLTRLDESEQEDLIRLCRQHRITIIASFPSLDRTQAESQRGCGVFEKSIATMQKLNRQGYGQTGSGLELSLVSNPTGAFLPPDQDEAEKRFREVLRQKFSVHFNHLYTFANMPLGRFRSWLKQSGNLEEYLQKLAERFNPCTVTGLMCRSLISVSWDGYLFDCDFNQACNLPLGGRALHITELQALPAVGSSIAVGDHCYTCTAGAGFT